MIKIPHTEYPSIARRRRGGETLKSIGETYGASRERIRQILRNHFPEIKTKNILKLRKELFDKERAVLRELCKCGCGTAIPRWRKVDRHWARARRYVPGHEYRNRKGYEITPEIRAACSAARKKAWADGKYKDRIIGKTIIMRRKVWTFLRGHPEGATIKEIVKATGVMASTLRIWVRTQKFMKFNARRQKDKRGHPYIISLAKEPPQKDLTK